MAGSRRTRVRRRVWVAGAVALITIVGAALWWVNRPAPAAAVQYDTVTVSLATQTQTVTVSGTINPQQQGNATFKVGGTVTSVAVKVGDKVAVGDPLATVDSRDLANAVTLAQAQLSAARAQLTTVKDTGKATTAQLDAARAQVTSAQASLDNARDRLADATLRSPLAGTIARVAYAVGDTVSGSTGAASVGTGGLSGAGLGGLSLPIAAGSGASRGEIVVLATNAWQLDADVGTADLPQLAAGQGAVITPTGTSLRVAAKVDTVGIVATQNAGASATFPVTLLVTDADAALFAGSSADAVVTTGTFPDVLGIPIAAVTTKDGASTVRLIKDGQPVSTAVTLGRRFGNVIEVTAGLKVGDQIQVPRAQVIAKPTQPAFGPNGRLASPATPTATPSA